MSTRTGSISSLRYVISLCISPRFSSQNNSNKKRPFGLFKWLLGWDCLAHSRLTAIPHFASWVSPNRKTAPASACSRSNQEGSAFVGSQTRGTLSKTKTTIKVALFCNKKLPRLSWICSTLGKFRNRTFGSSLLNFLAIRISLRSIRTQIRYAQLTFLNIPSYDLAFKVLEKTLK